MPKISDRDVRSLRRELHDARSKVLQIKKDSTYKLLECRKHLQIAKASNVILRQNAISLHDMFSDQQQTIRERNATIATLERVHYTEENKAIAKKKETTDVAAAMIAMSQQVCRTCLGTGSVFKTKKNIRYSARCKSCNYSL